MLRLILSSIRKHPPKSMAKCGSSVARKLRLFAVACCRRIWPLLDRSARKVVLLAEAHADGWATSSQLEVAVEEMSKSEERLRSEFFSRGHPLLPRDWEMTLFPGGWLNINPATWKTELEQSLRLSEICHPYSPDELREICVALKPFEAAGNAASSDALQVLNHASWGVCVTPNSARWALETPGEDATEWFREREAESAAQAHLIRDIFGNPFQPRKTNPAFKTSIVMSIARSIYFECQFDVMPILADALEEAGCNDDEILEHCRNGGPHTLGCWVVDSILRRKKRPPSETE